MTTKLTLESLRTLLDNRFGSQLLSGTHNEDGQCCAVELMNVARGNPWSDDPGKAGVPDMRRLNDARWSSDAVRTEAMLPLLAALSDWSGWTRARRVAWARVVALRTVREILPRLLARWPEHAKACAEAQDLEQARSAADAAAYAAAASAADAADADADSILKIACRIWLEAAESTEEQ